MATQEERGLLEKWARNLTDTRLAAELRWMVLHPRASSSTLRKAIIHEAARRIEAQSMQYADEAEQNTQQYIPGEPGGPAKLDEADMLKLERLDPMYNYDIPVRKGMFAQFEQWVRANFGDEAWEYYHRNVYDQWYARQQQENKEEHDDRSTAD